jgi:UDP-N-acetylglucosamine 2-epimerase (non-hydrolysing)
MPEEINRVVVDALATWLFTPSPDADENLLAEGVEPARIHRVGNVMVDSLLDVIETARLRPIRAALGLDDEPFGLVTLHRPALVDDPVRLASTMDVLHEVGRHVRLVFPVHPRTRAMLEQAGARVDAERVMLVPPQAYLDFLALEATASLVLTDSGGVQEETTVLGVPCLTLRENTERPVTVTRGTNTLVGFDPETIVAAARTALARPHPSAPIPLWDGRACERIVDVLCGAGPTPRFVPPALRAHASPEHRAGRGVLVP